MKSNTRHKEKFYSNVLRRYIINNNTDLMTNEESIYIYKYFAGFNPSTANFEFLKTPLSGTSRGSL